MDKSPEKSGVSAADRNRLIKLLNDVGLDDSEAAVYLAALGLGSRPASVIAQKAKLKRGQTYNVLNALIEKGIVQQVDRNGVKHFSCSSPKSLVGMLEARERELAQKRSELEIAIPELERLINPNINQPKVRYYQGLEGLKTVYMGILDEPIDTIYTITDSPYLYLFDSKEDRIAFARGFTAKRHENNIYWCGICSPSEALDEQVHLNPSQNRRMKRYPNHNLPSDIWIYGNKIALTVNRHEHVGVIIENENIAETMLDVFQRLWEILPDYV